MSVSRIEDSEKWAKFIPIRDGIKNRKEQGLLIEDSLKKEYEDLRNQFLAKYYYLPKKIAESMQKKLKEVTLDELISWGTDGLFDAVNRFSLSFNNKFETFASHRIRGSIYDNIRNNDWVPRLVRQRNNKISKAKNDLEISLGRQPTNEEVANYLKMPLDEYLNILSKSNPVSCFSMFAVEETNEENFGFITTLQSKDDSPNSNILKEEMFKKLLGKHFIPFERKIVYYHYYQGMTIKEIAQETGYSESRISQMHTKIVEKLKKRIELNPEYMNHIEEALGLS